MHSMLFYNKQCLQYLSGSVDPCKVTEMRVGGNANNVTVDCLKVLNVVTECNDFRWTDKCAGKQCPKWTTEFNSPSTSVVISMRLSL